METSPPTPAAPKRRSDADFGTNCTPKRVVASVTGVPSRLGHFFRVVGHVLLSEYGLSRVTCQPEGARHLSAVSLSRTEVKVATETSAITVKVQVSTIWLRPSQGKLFTMQLKDPAGGGAFSHFIRSCKAIAPALCDRNARSSVMNSWKIEFGTHATDWCHVLQIPLSPKEARSTCKQILAMVRSVLFLSLRSTCFFFLRFRFVLQVDHCLQVDDCSGGTQPRKLHTSLLLPCTGS